MKNLYLKYLMISLTLTIGLFSCEFEDQADPNNPSLQQLSSDATANELNNLVVGIESGLRNGLPLYVTSTGTVARELYLFNADPRNTIDLLGKNGGQIDNNTFYITAPYGGSYTNVKNTNILLAAIENSTLISPEEKNGYSGFAKTLQALNLSRVLNMLGDNGIRIDVNDPDNLGDFVSQAQALTRISELLNTGFTELNNAGSEFVFNLSDGFTGFDTPATFAQFNRALAARIAIYREEWGSVSGLLTDSFFDAGGDLNLGPKYSFSNSSGDQLNGLFKIPANNGDMIIVHNSFIADSEDGDLRVENKTSLRENPSSQDELSGTHETALYETPTTFIDIIRNEELILISAEAKLRAGAGNLPGAIDDLNIIRNAAGLDDYSGPQTLEAVTNELLMQRRYSLWCEGHRMVDLRRYGRLNAANLPVDRAGDQVFQRFPIPLTEAE